MISFLPALFQTNLKNVFFDEIIQVRISSGLCRLKQFVRMQGCLIKTFPNYCFRPTPFLLDGFDIGYIHEYDF